MALSVEVVKPLNDGRVQVDAKNKFFGKDVVNHFSVPKEKADEFISDFKKEEKRRTANGVASGVITAGAMLLGGLASKNANVLLKGLSVVLFGAAGAVASVVGFGMNNAKRLNKLFEKHDADPIVYLKDGQTAKAAQKPEAPKPDAAKKEDIKPAAEKPAQEKPEVKTEKEDDDD